MLLRSLTKHVKDQNWFAVALDFFIVVIAGILVASCSPEGDVTDGADGAPVGLMRLALEDPQRSAWDGVNARPLTTSLWYPAAEGSQMEEIGIPPTRPVFIGGFAARGAALAPSPTPYPLIIMSHGTGGAGMQMMWLGRELAANGYIVAAVDHHGNTAAEEKFDPRGFRMPWERAKDLSTVIDLLLADPQWGPQKILLLSFFISLLTIERLKIVHANPLVFAVI